MSVTESRPSAAVLTQGCKVNQYESEAIAEALAARGFTIRPPQEVCDLYVVNTCTVTAESDRKARQAIRRLLSENPEAFLIVTGCSAQKAADAIVEAAKDGPFLSKDDFRQRTKVSKTIIDLMDSLGLLGDLPESNQISIFDLV